MGRVLLNVLILSATLIAMFCIKCGAPAAAGNFCKKCFLGRERLFSIKNFRLTKCSSCGSYFIGAKKSGIADTVRRNIVTGNKITRIRVSYRTYANRIMAMVECSGFIRSFRKTEKRPVEIIVSTKKCDACAKLAGSYYEAVLQIRGDRAKEILDKVARYNVLSLVKDAHTGYDVRVVRRQDAARIANALGHNALKTFKLVGEKSGKKIYRVYYSIR